MLNLFTFVNCKNAYRGHVRDAHWIFKMIPVLAGVIFLLLSASNLFAKDIIEIQMKDNSHSFHIDLAKTREEQEQGLMFVEDLPDNHGMVFVYNDPQAVKFWMKNTLIPLDMLFFDDQNSLVYIENNAQPHDLTPRGPAMNVGICSVLELNGGMAKKLNIQTGAKLITNFPQECLHSLDKK